MGHEERARKVISLALAMAAVEAAILFFVPDGLSRLVGIGGEIAFRLIFPVFMEKEFVEWQATHADVRPSNGWRAIAWGLPGVVLFFVMLFVVFFGLYLVLPGRL